MPTIVSFDDLKSVLSLSKDAITDYPNLAIIQDSVHVALEDYAGRRLGGIEKLSESGFINNENHIDLENLPITSVTSVKIDGVAVTNYTIDKLGITLNSNASGKWEIVTKGGFKNIPSAIYRAELFQITYEYQNINNLAAKSFTNDGGTVSLPGYVLLEQTKSLINKYLHPKKLGF